MMELSPCERCGTHVRAGEPCPFCARRPRSRWAIGALSLGLAACTPPPVAVYGGPPEPEPGLDAAAPETAAPETAAPESTAPETAAPETVAPETAPTPDPAPAPAYGGPPPRLPTP